MIETVTFGDLVLSDYGEVVDVRRTPAGIELSTEQVAGRDGDVLKGARLKQPEVSCLLVAKHVGVQRRRRLVRLLSPLLLATEFQRLAFSSDEGLYYRAILSQGPELSEYVNAGTLRLTFMVDGAAMYGDTVSKPMSGTTAIRVNGTYPTPLRISGSATPSGGYFAVRLDGADFARVAMSAAGAIDIDSGARTCKVAGVTKQLTLDSDWLVLEAGNHTLTFDAGSGDLTLEWTERWL